MCALYRAPADVQRRTNNLIHSQRFCAHRCAYYVHHGIHCADFVKVDSFDVLIVNLGLGPAQCLENCNRLCLGGLADLRLANDLADLCEPASMLMSMWRGRFRPRCRLALGEIVLQQLHWLMFMAMAMFMMMIVMIVLMLFPRRIFLALRVNIDLDCADAAAVHPRNLEARPNVQRRDGFFQQSCGHTCVHQRTQKHVAANAGKTLEIGYEHQDLEPQRTLRYTKENSQNHLRVPFLGYWFFVANTETSS